MKSNAKTGFLIVAIVLAAVIGCGSGCVLVMKLYSLRPKATIDASHTADDRLDQHGHLKLREDQEKGMKALEEKFSPRAAELRKQIREANAELAEALIQDRSYSQRVTDAVERIHRAQGDLQKATVEHIIEMRSVLDDHQFEDFLALTTRELREN